MSLIQNSSYRGRGNNLNLDTMVEGGPPQVQQMELSGADSTRIDINRESNEHFGDQIRQINQDQTIRIGFINVNGLPMTTDNPKNKIIYNTITNKQLSILPIILARTTFKLGGKK